jgi:hypothetical protein
MQNHLDITSETTRPEAERAEQIPLPGFGRPAPPKRDRAPLAANSDPLSSHLAAKRFTDSGARGRQKREFIAWLRGQTEPLTSAEIAAMGGFDRHSVARRLPDLERDRLVARGPMRRCRVAGTPAIVWAVRPEGYGA